MKKARQKKARQICGCLVEQKRLFFHSTTAQSVELALCLLANGVIGAQGKGLLQGGAGAIPVTGPGADEAQGQPDALKAGVKPGTGAKDLHGFGRLARVVKGQPQVVAGIDVIRR